MTDSKRSNSAGSGKLTRRTVIKAGAATAAAAALSTPALVRPRPAAAAYPSVVVWSVTGLTNQSGVLWPDHATDIDHPVLTEVCDHSHRFNCGGDNGFASAAIINNTAGRLVYTSAHAMLTMGGTPNYQPGTEGAVINEVHPTATRDQYNVLTCTSDPVGPYNAWQLVESVIVPVANALPNKRIYVYVTDPGGANYVDPSGNWDPVAGVNYQFNVEHLANRLNTSHPTITPRVTFVFECYTPKSSWNENGQPQVGNNADGTRALALWLPTLVGKYGLTWNNIGVCFTNATEYGGYNLRHYKNSQPNASLRPRILFIYPFFASTSAEIYWRFNYDVAEWL